MELHSRVVRGLEIKATLCPNPVKAFPQWCQTNAPAPCSKLVTTDRSAAKWTKPHFYCVIQRALVQLGWCMVSFVPILLSPSQKKFPFSVSRMHQNFSKEFQHKLGPTLLQYENEDLAKAVATLNFSFFHDSSGTKRIFGGHPNMVKLRKHENGEVDPFESTVWPS